MSSFCSLENKLDLSENFLATEVVAKSASEHHMKAILLNLIVNTDIYEVSSKFHYLIHTYFYFQ